MIEALLKEPRKLLFLLLPGFVSQRIAEYYTAGFRGETHDRILIAVSFTLINLLVLAGLSTEVRGGLKSGSGVRLTGRIVGYLLLISIITGLLGGIVADSRLPFRLGLTKRTSQYSVWVSTIRAFKECSQDEVIVRVKDGGGMYYGQIGRYSGDGDTRQIYLKPAWRIASGRASTEPESYTNEVSINEVQPNGTPKLDTYRITGLLLSGDQITSIEFIRRPGEPDC